MYKAVFLFLITTISFSSLYAQADSSITHVQFSGFADVYYVYDLHAPSAEKRQPFLYNHNRHNQFNINLALLKAQFTEKNYRATIALQAGTYPNDNYAAEPSIFRYFFEAHAGISLNKNKTFWLDAGLLPSHIGFESAISMDNYTLTRSLAAENSPYYLSGAKLAFSPGKKISLAFILCNGWQRIKRVEANSLLSWGTQISYQPSVNLNVNWSTFVGTDDPDSTRRMRYFNNFFGRMAISEKLNIITGFDVGLQQSEKNSSSYNTWFTPVMVMQYKFIKTLAAALRLEYFNDPAGVIIPTGTPNGFRTSGISINIDYLPVENVACRIESRLLHARDKIFKDDRTAQNNFIIAGSIAVKIP
jgi:hypothetical protein